MIYNELASTLCFQYLEVWREVPVGLVLVGLVQVVLGQREDQEVPLAGVAHHHRRQVLLRFPQGARAAVLQFAQVLLRPRDEERVDPEVEHLFLETGME